MQSLGKTFVSSLVSCEPKGRGRKAPMLEQKSQVLILRLFSRPNRHSYPRALRVRLTRTGIKDESDLSGNDKGRSCLDSRSANLSLCICRRGSAELLDGSEPRLALPSVHPRLHRLFCAIEKWPRRKLRTPRRLSQCNNRSRAAVIVMNWATRFNMAVLSCLFPLLFLTGCESPMRYLQYTGKDANSTPYGVWPKGS